MILPTRRGRLLLLLSVLLYLASLTAQSGLLVLLIGLILGCYLVNAISAGRTIKSVVIVAPPSDQIAEGHKLAKSWRVQNQGREPAGSLDLTLDGTILFQIDHLLPGEEKHVLPSLQFLRRGVHSYGQTRLRSSYPFGLVQVERWIHLAGEVVVYPAVYPASPPQVSGHDTLLGGKLKGRRLAASGAVFAGVRPWQPGDSLKQIHWQSSAKGQGFMVKTFDEELSGRVSIIVDSGDSGNRTALDDGVRAAGSLLFASLEAGNHAELVELGTLAHHLIPPFTTNEHLLDLLARLEMKPHCLEYSRLSAAVDLVSRKSALVFVATRLTDSLRQIASEAAAGHRLVHVYVPATTARGEDTEDFVRYYSGTNIE